MLSRPQQSAPMRLLKQVSVFELFYLYCTYRNFCDAVKELESRYSTNEFEITYPFMASLFIIQEKEHVKKVLTSNTTLGYQYHNADLVHGHKLNIIAAQAFKSSHDMSHNPLWENIHKGLSQSTGDEMLINKLIDKHIPILFSSSRFMLDIQFEKFMLAFWCEYMFGDKVNIEEFSRTRTKLNETMRYAFYNNSFKNAPWIGGFACRFYGWMKTNEFKQIDAELKQYIDKADAGLMYRFKEKLIASRDFPVELTEQAVLDNAFDLVLVFDFLHNALYETLATIVKEKLETYKARRDSYAPGLRSAFLFPFRSRVAQQDITLDGTVIPQGSQIYIDLLKSGLYHSYGPRACIGEGVTTWVRHRFFYHLKDIQLQVLNKTFPADRAVLSHCADVPISPERYEVSWQPAPLPTGDGKPEERPLVSLSQ